MKIKKVKRILSVSTILMILSTTIPMNDIKVLAMDSISKSDVTTYIDEQGIKYELINNIKIAIVSSKNNVSGNIVIPEEVKCNGQSYSVTNIEGNAFSSCSNLTSIIIPNSVTSIGDYAFNKCSGLISATISSSVTSIGDNVFSYCDSLNSISVDKGNSKYSSEDGILFNKEKTNIILYPNKKNGEEYSIPSSVTRIEDEAFCNCSALKSITIPSSVRSIGFSAFYNCKGIKSITIPSGVTSIGSYAFYNCSGVRGITIPSSVTSIGRSAFSDCYSLIAIIVDKDNNQYSSEDGILFNKAKTDIILYPSKKTGKEYSIPSSVTRVEDSAFCNCFDITSITIPSSVTEIGRWAFANCMKLKSLNLARNIINISADAFLNDYNMQYKIIGKKENDDWNYSQVVIQPFEENYKYISIDKINWENSLSLYSNKGTITFYLKKADGTIIEREEIINVDNVPTAMTVKPMIGSVDYKNGELTEKDITFYMIANKINISGVTYYYSTDNRQTWTQINGETLTVSTTSDDTYIFRSKTGAGLIEESPSYKVNIQKPVAKDFKVNTNGYESGKCSKEDVVVNLSGGILDEAKILEYQYSIDNKEWITMPESSDGIKKDKITISSGNAGYYFRVISKEGTIVNTTEKSSQITVDKEQPLLEINTDGYEEGKFINKDLTVKLSNSTNNLGTATYEYRLKDETEWKSCNAQIVFNESGSFDYVFRVTSEAGVKSEEKSLKVNIDKTIPTIEVTGSSEIKVDKETLKIITSVGPSGKTVTVKKDNGEEVVVKGDTYEVTENGIYTFTITNGLGVKVGKEVNVKNIGIKEPEITPSTGTVTGQATTTPPTPVETSTGTVTGQATTTPPAPVETATVTPGTTQTEKEEKSINNTSGTTNSGDVSQIPLVSSLMLGAIAIIGVKRKKQI